MTDDRKQKKMSEETEAIAKRYEGLKTLVNSLSNNERKNSLMNMIEGDIGIKFVTTSASRRISHHNCYPGGLYDHSISVVGYLNLLNKTLIKNENERYSRDEIIMVGLFHDLGKVGNLDQDYYEPQVSDWHREKLGELYIYNENMPYLHHSERSVWILNHFGVSLSEIETQAILYHDMLYIPKGEMIKYKEDRLTILLHFADLYDAKFGSSKR